MKISRAEKGCIDYAFLPDPIESDRVTLFERWETPEDLTAHLAAMQAAASSSAPRMLPKAAQVTFYDATERPRPGS
jgi:quinol monooxygenase YgiN